MKIALVALLFAVSALAQDRPGALPAACGPKNVSFHVQLDESQHPLAKPETGMAMVYFIQDNGMGYGIGNFLYQHFTLKIGMDGAWVGAYKKNSYFAVSVVPGEHHVCANVQSNLSVGHLQSLAHFTAAPGKVYYFHTQFLGGEFISRYPFPEYVSFNQIDSDEGKYLIATYPLSLSKPAK